MEEQFVITRETKYQDCTSWVKMKAFYKFWFGIARNRYNPKNYPTLRDMTRVLEKDIANMDRKIKVGIVMLIIIIWSVVASISMQNKVDNITNNMNSQFNQIEYQMKSDMGNM